MSKILVTGSEGQLGKSIESIRNDNPDLDFVFRDMDLDITSRNISHEIGTEIQPDYIINCAAYTKVDQAEDEREQARSINVEGVGNLARVCKEYSIKLIHISTDYVFDGSARAPYSEGSETRPVNFYGETKLDGEKRIQDLYNEGSIIIRTSWLYSSFGNNFVDTMIRLGETRESLNVVNDQIGAPTYALDLAHAIIDIIKLSEKEGNFVPGIFNFQNEGEISWFDFAEEIMSLSDLDCQIIGISTAEYPTKAKRPVYSVLNTEKIKKYYGIEIKDWKESLKSCIGKS